MAKDFQGRTYNEDWVPIDAMGNALGGKDWAANAAYAAETGTQNPYTNEAGASPYDKSGLIPGNEPGSTLPRVTGPTRKSSLPFNPINSIQPFPFQSQPFGTPVAPPVAVKSPISGGLTTSSATRRRSDEPGDEPRDLSDFLTPYDVNSPFAEDDGSGLARLAQLLLGVTR